MTTVGNLKGARALVVARSTTLHANSGGMETSSAALAVALQELGATTALVTTATGEASLPPGFQGHSAIWEVQTPKPGRYSREWWANAHWDGPWQGWEPSLVIGEGDAAVAFTKRRRAPIPIVVHCHGTTMMEAASALAGSGARAPAKALVNLGRTPSRMAHLKRADLILVAGTSVDASLGRIPYRINQSRRHLVANSIDRDRFAFESRLRNVGRASLKICAHEPLYLSVGRLEPDKGVDLAIQAVMSLPVGRLAIVGRGPAATSLRTLANRLGAGERVLFLGKQTQEELTVLMSAADQLVFPTRRREAGGTMVMLEAAASGLPVVTTSRAGTPSALSGLSQVREVAAHAAAVAGALLPAPTDPGQRGCYLPDEFNLATLPVRLGQALAPLLGTVG